MKQCAVCDRIFSRRDNLKRHYRNVHQDQNEDPIKKPKYDMDDNSKDTELSDEHERQEYWTKGNEPDESSYGDMDDSPEPSLGSPWSDQNDINKINSDEDIEDEDSEEEPEDKTCDVYLRNLIVPRINEECRALVIEKSQPHIEKGDDATTAECKAINENLQDIRQRAIDLLAVVLNNILIVSRSPLYRSIMSTVQRLREHVSLDLAVKETLDKHKSELGLLLISEKKIDTANT